MLMDIRNSQLHITQLIRVLQSYLTRRHIPCTSSRARDGFVYILSGSCVYTFGDGTCFTAQPGDVLYLAKDADYEMDVDCDRYSYIFCDFLFSPDERRQSFVLTPKSSPEFERLFRQLKNIYDLSGAARLLSCMSLLYQIYALLVENRQTHYVPGSSRAKIEAARNWVCTHLADPELRVSQLARSAEMSEVHFRKLFHTLYGVTPTHYITSQRVAFAKKLMELEELQLEEVALQSGFSSLPYFCKVFKAETGLTPAVYRHAILKENTLE